MDANLTHYKSPRWFWIASICFGLGLFDATQTVVVMRAEGMHHAWMHLFMMMLLTWLPWAFATPLVLQIGRPYPPLRFRSFSSASLKHLAAFLCIGSLSAAWGACLEESLHPWGPSSLPGPFVDFWLRKFYNQILWSLILYGCIVLAGYMLDSEDRLALQQREAARLSKQLFEAQLNALRQQIEPHFLFNTLNAIAGLVREGRNDAAVITIAGLSDLLRRVLEDSNRQHVPLGEELEFLQKYLDIQKVRFVERLQVSIDISQEFFLARVPILILQPIVENAVTHGVAKRAHGGMIQITAIRSKDMLILDVYNDDPCLTPDWEKSHSGIGISNIRTRLQSLYGNAFELSIRNQFPGGVKVSISLPFREE